MKILKLFIVFLFLFSFVFAADVFNVGTYYNGNQGEVPTTGNIVAFWEDYNHVIVKYRFTFVDSSNAYHSKPFYIGNCNLNDAYVYAIQSTTGDANVIMHYCPDDRNTWQAIIPAGLDAVSSAAKTDTLGYQAGADDGVFHCARWAVIECVGGSSSNQDDNIMTVVIKFRKNEYGGTTVNGQWIKLHGWAKTNNTNP